MKINLGQTDTIQKNSMKTFFYEDLVFLVVNLEGKYFAYDGQCPHRKALIGSGQLNGNIVTCQWHQHQFDLRDSKCLTNRFIKLKGYTVVIVNNEIVVEME